MPTSILGCCNNNPTTSLLPLSIAIDNNVL